MQNGEISSGFSPIETRLRSPNVNYILYEDGYECVHLSLSGNFDKIKEHDVLGN